MAKKTEAAIKKTAREHNEAGTTIAADIELRAGDSAWNPYGDDFTGPCRVTYHFHDNGDPVGVMEMVDVPPFI